MSISFLQQSKELFAADFQLIHRGCCIGRLHLQGKLGSREGKWSGQVLNREVCLSPSARKYGFRSYDITVNGAAMGGVGMMDVKSGFLSRYQYHRMCYADRVYDLFPVGLGGEGSAGCLYLGRTQVAQIDKEAAVKNDLHNFEIFALDEDSAFISALMCCYMYVLGCYRAGEKVSSSTVVHSAVTTNKVLRAKYNPEFKSSHRFL